MGFEAKAEGRAADGAKAPLSLEENYREWLRSMRDRIDSELAGEERAAEFLKKTLPRLEEDCMRLNRRCDEEMPEESKLQMLKDFVLDSMLREPPAEEPLREGEARVRIREEEEEEDEKKKRAGKDELLRSKKYLVASGVVVSSLAVFMVSIIFALREDMSPSESQRFMCFQTAVIAIFGASVFYRDHVIRLLSGRTAAQLSCESPPASAAAGVATAVALSSLAVLTFSGFFIPSEPMSPAEFLRLMCFQAAVVVLFWVSVMVRNHLIESRSRVELLPS